MISVDSGIFTLSNDHFVRQLRVDERGLTTVAVQVDGKDFARRTEVAEFYFFCNGIRYESWNKSGNPQFKFVDHSVANLPHNGEELRLDFDFAVGGRVTVCYDIFPDLTGCIKHLEFAAREQELTIEKLVLEMFNLAPGDPGDLIPYREQGRVPCEPCFTITGEDDILNFHDPEVEAGFWTGSSIPGPLRFVLCYPNWSSGAMYGYSRSIAPTVIYVTPEHPFRSAEVYLLAYCAPRSAAQPRNDFRELIRRSLPELRAKSGVMYCTWVPFAKDINQSLVETLTDRAAQLGFATLVLDDGWFTSDFWQVDAAKFPQGLEAVSDYVHGKGLNFGLWFNIGSDYGAPDSRLEDNSLDSEHHYKDGGNGKTRCFASAHREWVIGKLTELAKRYKVDYFKMDFSNVISPYGVLPIGCHSTKHAHHRNSQDAVVEQYRSLAQVGTEVRANTGALIDYSFEVFGTEKPGIASLQCADIQHISNYNTETGDYPAYRIRSAFYHFVRVMPPERMLGGLIEISGAAYWENLLTSMLMMPLVAGDLRDLSTEAVARVHMASWNFEAISQSGPLTELEFLHGDREIMANQPDGYCRFSRDGRRALVAIFANKSGAADWEFRLEFPQDGRYHVRDLATGELVAGCTAAELQRGIRIAFNGEPARGLVLTLEA